MGDETVTAEKQSQYNSAYYEKNKAKIQQSRRDRYKSDPQYRAKVQQAALDRKAKIREQKKAGRGDAPAKKRGPDKPKVFLIEVAGTDVEVVMMSAGQLAKALRRKTQTLRLWEKKGLLPEAMYRNNANDRLYTAFQVSKLKEAYDKAVLEDGLKKVTNRISLTIFPKLAREVWDDYPQGVDMA